MTAKSSAAAAKETEAQQAKQESDTKDEPTTAQRAAEAVKGKQSTGTTAEDQAAAKGGKAAEEGDQLSPTLATSNPHAPDTSHGDKLSDERNRETAEAGTAALVDVEDVSKLTFQTKQFDTSSPVAMDTHDALAFPELLDGTEEVPKKGTQPQEEPAPEEEKA